MTKDLFDAAMAWTGHGKILAASEGLAFGALMMAALLLENPAIAVDAAETWEAAWDDSLAEAAAGRAKARYVCFFPV